MSSIAQPTSLARPAVNPWMIAVAVVIPTFMEVLDTTIANVALRYIAGGLSAASVDAEWVLTSYLAANATILPITGWLSAHLGRRNYFLLSIAVFTIASGLCGIATSLEQLIFFRVLQGLGGGGLQPSSQAILLDSFPPEKQGAAQTMFGFAALLAPVVGPTLGGYLTVTYDWRWIFYINVPVGIASLAAAYFLVDDPDYLKKQRAEQRGKPLNFDYIGLGMLILVISAWEILLSKGQEWDWYNDPFWRVQTLFILFAGGLIALIIRELRIKNPVIDFRPLGERNYAACCIIIFCAYGVLYGGTTSLPGLLQSQFGYDAYVSGLVQSPAGLFSIMGLVIVGALIGRGIDARIFIALGLLVMAVGNFWMSQMNIYISPFQVVWPRVVFISGLSLIFVSINVAAFKYTPPHLRGAAVGLFALLRNEGGSVGTSMAQTFVIRREQFHLSRIGEFLDPLNPTLNDYATQGHAYFLHETGDPAASQLMTWQALADLRQQQASSMSYFDAFWLFSALAVSLVFLVLLMKRSVAEKGEHIGAE